MNLALTFDDVLIRPLFSTIKSRKDIALEKIFGSYSVQLPVMNANMDTVASVDMCQALFNNGGVGTLHRFCSIEENVATFRDARIASGKLPIVSVGVGSFEEKRAEALLQVGADIILIDVAHAASSVVVDFFVELRKLASKNVSLIVGNFGTGEELTEFLDRCESRLSCNTMSPHKYQLPYAVKVGIGGGSLCTTRIVTGCGMPTLSSVIECSKLAYARGVKVIADGGIRSTGDIVKALVAGADMVMLGSMFAGTDEAPGSIIKDAHGTFKEYRGSASLSSYVVQGKVATWRAPEGEATLVPYKGSVKGILENINGGIRSACSYVGAHTYSELCKNASFVQVTSNAVIESGPHGKR